MPQAASSSERQHNNAWVFLLASPARREERKGKEGGKGAQRYRLASQWIAASDMAAGGVVLSRVSVAGLNLRLQSSEDAWSG